jgi:hypothetical protein
MSDELIAPDGKPWGKMRWIKYWISGFGSAAIVLCLWAIQRDLGLLLAGAFLALLGIVGLIADLRSLRE